MNRLNQILSPSLEAMIGFFFYRYRFLILYTMIGFLSILLEIVIYRGLTTIGISVVLAYFIAFAASIIFAYWFNIRLNFKVPIAKRNRAIYYFVVISLCSGIVNFGFRMYFEKWGWSYEQSRLTASAILFMIAYYLHRRFSFYDYKRVGVAIYANGIEDIRKIHQCIASYPDFIHVDLIDDTYGENQLDPKVYRIEVIRAFWPDKEIHVHLMSRKPTRWLSQLFPYIDVLIIHTEIDDDVAQVLKMINDEGKKAGLCLQNNTPIESVRHLAHLTKIFMLLSISTPGKSGQSFEISTLDRIAEMNRWDCRSQFIICVDGGINEKNIGLLNVELVVSGSSVLNNQDPIKQIMRLQTASNYERI